MKRILAYFVLLFGLIELVYAAPAAELPGVPVVSKPMPEALRKELRAFLFKTLIDAPDVEVANKAATHIKALWLKTASPTASLLMGRVKAAQEAKDQDLALALLDAVVETAPDFFEARNMRAAILYTKHDFAGTMRDINIVLSQEPLHFEALAGLGTMMLEMGEERRALEVFRFVLAIHPYLGPVIELEKKLTVTVEGRDI